MNCNVKQEIILLKLMELKQKLTLILLFTTLKVCYLTLIMIEIKKLKFTHKQVPLAFSIVDSLNRGNLHTFQMKILINWVDYFLKN